MKGTENTAIDMSVADKLMRYFLKSANVLLFLIRITMAHIFVTKAKDAVPPYSKAKIVTKGSESANKSDNSAVELDEDKFAKYSSFKARIGSIL
jgi:hypothetical protein